MRYECNLLKVSGTTSQLRAPICVCGSQELGAVEGSWVYQSLAVYLTSAAWAVDSWSTSTHHCSGENSDLPSLGDRALGVEGLYTALPHLV
jgi:hypothetical protein